MSSDNVWYAIDSWTFDARFNCDFYIYKLITLGSHSENLSVILCPQFPCSSAPEVLVPWIRFCLKFGTWGLLRSAMPEAGWLHDMLVLRFPRCPLSKEHHLNRGASASVFCAWSLRMEKYKCNHILLISRCDSLRHLAAAINMNLFSTLATLSLVLQYVVAQDTPSPTVRLLGPRDSLSSQSPGSWRRFSRYFLAKQARNVALSLYWLQEKFWRWSQG